MESSTGAVQLHLTVHLRLSKLANTSRKTIISDAELIAHTSNQCPHILASVFEINCFTAMKWRKHLSLLFRSDSINGAYLCQIQVISPCLPRLTPCRAIAIAR